MKWPGIVRAQVDGEPAVHCTYDCSAVGKGEGNAALVQQVVTAGVLGTNEVHCTPRDCEGFIGHWFPEPQAFGNGAVLIVIAHCWVPAQYG